MFVSWPWMRAYFEVATRRPLILCYRPANENSFVAFLPLAIDGFPRSRALLNRDLFPFGNPHGDYAGMIAVPEHEREALRAFRDYLAAEHWDNFHAHDLHDERMTALVESFSPDRFRTATRAETKCPYIPLPSTWDEYLRTRLKKHFRGDLRRSIRLVEALPDFRAEVIDRHNVERIIDLTLHYAQSRYRNSPRYRREQRALLLNCFRTGCLVGMGLWTGSSLLASVLAFVDHHGREFCAYKTAFNPEFAKYSPGTVVTGFMIRYAIERQFQVYDFSRGGERYKSLFGTALRYTRHHTITRNGVRSAIGNAVRPFIRAPGRVAEKILSRVPA
ncbi:MAG: GNAT family N-acetyltransferase [Candidatus Eremiobacteraeota bacterium]|nr:GNAT family N-acetyltransferase [Candidatus Eremiobacteraeota bacterium]